MIRSDSFIKNRYKISSDFYKVALNFSFHPFANAKNFGKSLKTWIIMRSGSRHRLNFKVIGCLVDNIHFHFLSFSKAKGSTNTWLLYTCVWTRLFYKLFHTAQLVQSQKKISEKFGKTSVVSTIMRWMCKTFYLHVLLCVKSMWYSLFAIPP